MKKSVKTKWNGKLQVCEHCGKETKTIYVVTGHDHTDSSIQLCDCGSGRNVEDVWNENPYAREAFPQSLRDYLK